MFELRDYTCPNNSKQIALQRRFREHTMKLFEKHCMQNIVYWVPDERPDSQHKYSAARVKRPPRRVSQILEKTTTGQPREEGLRRNCQVFMPGLRYRGPLWLAGGLSEKYPGERDFQRAREFAAGIRANAGGA